MSTSKLDCLVDDITDGSDDAVSFFWSSFFLKKKAERLGKPEKDTYECGVPKNKYGGRAIKSSMLGRESRKKLDRRSQRPRRVKQSS